MSTETWEAITDTADFAADPAAWVTARMNPGMPWLLVHVDDGVIWGRWQADGGLLLSSDLFADPKRHPATGAKLQGMTVQQLRIFGPEGEILLWRDDDDFQGRRVADGSSMPEDCWEEQHILWGTRQEEQQGFTLLEEGDQGQIHAVPLSVADNQRAALTVRHYLAADEDGQASVVMSRLTNLGIYDSQRGR